MRVFLWRAVVEVKRVQWQPPMGGEVSWNVVGDAVFGRCVSAEWVNCRHSGSGRVKIALRLLEMALMGARRCVQGPEGNGRRRERKKGRGRRRDGSVGGQRWWSYGSSALRICGRFDYFFSFCSCRYSGTCVPCASGGVPRHHAQLFRPGRWTSRLQRANASSQWQPSFERPRRLPCKSSPDRSSCTPSAGPNPQCRSARCDWPDASEPARRPPHRCSTRTTTKGRRALQRGPKT